MASALVEAADGPARLMGEDTAAVVKLDLTRLSASALAKQLYGEAAGDLNFIVATEAVDKWIDNLRSAGATELYLFYQFADLPGSPIVAVPLKDGVNLKRISEVLVRGIPGFRIKEATGIGFGGMIVVGRPPALEKLQAQDSTPRPDLVAALDEGPMDARVRVAISPGLALRRATEESMANLPVSLGAGPISTVTQGARWLSMVVPSDTSSKVRVTLQAKNADSARDLTKLIKLGAEAAGRTLQANPAATNLAPILSHLQPEPRGDRVVADLDLQATYSLISVPLQAVRDASERTQTVQNLKLMSLAMHNYHSTHDTFAPAYRADANHNPLLSWRVLILPFLDEEALYNEFHLDEPWDSQHNRALIPRMPRVFASPLAAKALAVDGKTVYLTPRGASTMFPGELGKPIKSITDGTSNTIMILQAEDAEAVIWTKPDDWNADNRPNLPAGRIIAAFGDGSVRTMNPTNREVIRKMLTANGGEVIRPDEW